MALLSLAIMNCCVVHAFCMYLPKGSLQCLLKSIVKPVTIVHRLSVMCIPFLWQFNQKTALYAISTMSWWGSCLNGILCVMALIQSLIVLLYLSTSGTCLSQAVVLTFMPINSICFVMHLNFLTASICRVLKPIP